MINFSEPFVKGLILQKNKNSKFSEIRQLAQKYEKVDDLNDEKLYKELLSDIIQHFSNSEYGIMKSYHKNVSTATGINVGFITHYKNDFRRNSVLSILQRMFSKLLDNNYIKRQKNECRECIFSLLNVYFI